MFDELIREFRQLEHGIRLPIQIPLDEKGYMDRECPNPACRAPFKVLFDDWRDIVSDDGVYCPICRHEAAATEWNTEEQSRYIRRAGIRRVQDMVHRGLQSSARRFNRSQSRSGFVKMSMSCRRTPLPAAVPPEARDLLRQDFACERCACRYSAVGAAFFCPACGHDSAIAMFHTSLQTVRNALVNLDAIETAVAQATDQDTAANFVRHALEDALVKLVGSFQRYAEALFVELPNSSAFKLSRNVFQRLKESSELWRHAQGKGYDDLITQRQLDELQTFFQQRHLLAHREGIVDQDYIDRSGDRSYVVGQRLLIRPRAVSRLLDILQSLATGLHALR